MRLRLSYSTLIQCEKQLVNLNIIYQLKFKKYYNIYQTEAVLSNHGGRVFLFHYQSHYKQYIGTLQSLAY